MVQDEETGEYHNSDELIDSQVEAISEQLNLFDEQTTEKTENKDIKKTPKESIEHLAEHYLKDLVPDRFKDIPILCLRQCTDTIL